MQGSLIDSMFKNMARVIWVSPPTPLHVNNTIVFAEKRMAVPWPIYMHNLKEQKKMNSVLYPCTTVEI